MSVQSVLNKNSLRELPKVSDAIANAGEHEKNQMRWYALFQMCDSLISFHAMNDEQKIAFQNDLLETFKHKVWL